MEKENYYEILGVSVDASSEEIKKALNEQYRKWSYQLNAPSMDRRQQAEKMLKKLEMMEETLLDEEKRKQYDQKLKEKQEKKVTHIVEVKKLSKGQIPPASKKGSSSKQEKKEVKVESSSQQEKEVVINEPFPQQEKREVNKTIVYVEWIKQSKWIISIFVVLFIVVISFVSWNLLADEETPATPQQEKMDMMKPENLLKEIKENAEQGTVYGVPFKIGATMEEVRAAWGLPENGKFVERETNYYPDKNIGLEFCEQKVCAIISGRRWRTPTHFVYELSPRYEVITFDQVEEVLGKNYVIEHEYYSYYTYKFSNYYLRFSVDYGWDEATQSIDQTEKKILFFSVTEPY